MRLSTLFSSLGPQGAALRPLLGQAGDTVAFALDADEDEISVETATLGVEGRGRAERPGRGARRRCPATRGWRPGPPTSARRSSSSSSSSASSARFGGVDVDQVLRQFEQQTGIDLREDVLSWMGDAGVFVPGTTLSDIGGALVVESKDAAKSEAFVGELAAR